MRLANYLDRIRLQFRFVDADADGELSEKDAALHQLFAQARFRAYMAAEIMLADVNGDGLVTADELRSTLQYNGRALHPSAAVIEAEVRKLMTADTDHDGSISATEAEAFSSTQLAMMPPNLFSKKLERFLALAPEGKRTLSLADLEAAAEKLFRAVDVDGDGTASAEELKNFRTERLSK